MKVLLLHIPAMVSPWLEDIVKTINGRHQVDYIDFNRPVAPQFAGTDVVVDQGGGVGTREMIDAAAASGVKLWQVLGTGLDNTDVVYILEKGLMLANTPGQFSAIALAEHALCLMLYLIKNCRPAQDSIRSRIRCQPMNDELFGKTLGLIGFGASARELARRAAALGMKIQAIDAAPCPRETLNDLHVSFFGNPEQLDRLLKESDVISIHVPLLPKTRHLISKRELGLMKPTAYLINIARGEIIDDAALTEALQQKRIAGAGLDVFAEEPVNPDDPLLKFENVLATPHVAGVTWGTSRRRAEAVVENIERVAQGLPPLYQVTTAED